MILRPRVQRLIFSRTWKALLALLVIWTTYEVVTIRGALYQEAAKDPPPFGDQRIFIASIHWTDERVLREYWVPAVAQLAQDIGREHVFVSVLESGSLDNSKGALWELDEQLNKLGIPHKVILDESSHLDEVNRGRNEGDEGWVQMPITKSYLQNWTDYFTLEKGSWQPRRIPYLARLRNEALQPLYEQQAQGIMYDKILWLNDIVFTTPDAQRLLATRDGHYAAACALDFKKAPAFYDTFALRDPLGLAPLTDTWPFFHSAQARSALQAGQPVLVVGCWNGMVAFDTAPFYHDRLSFRAIPDSLAKSHVEGSECCLIHADNPLSRTKGVWVNPNVRVGYNGTSYNAVNDDGIWPSSYAIATGLWRNRLLRWTQSFRASKGREVVSRFQEWKAGSTGVAEPGPWCLIDEMQILLWNGWGHA